MEEGRGCELSKLKFIRKRKKKKGIKGENKKGKRRTNGLGEGKRRTNGLGGGNVRGKVKKGEL